MIIPFLFELRGRGVPVGVQEAIALAKALEHGLHESSLDGFYRVARALLVHREAHLDAFDEAFLSHFRGVQIRSIEIHDELLEWLREAAARSDLSPQEAALLQDIDPDELFEQFQQRLRDQKERHDGGSHWIGTGGSSPFGHGGHARSGIRVGGAGGNRSAIAIAAARHYRPYRSDVTLDVRQMALALRKLRAFGREGQEELDLEETIDATAKNAGELEVVTRPPRRPNTRVILLMDVGGSMDPYAHLVSRLFTAASKSTHFKELRSYYFHNCVYGRVYHNEVMREGITVEELIASCGKHYKLIVVGDALMAPYELVYPGFSRMYGSSERGAEGIVWLQMLAGHFERSAWLNPEPPKYWPGTTIESTGRVFPMFPLTLDGLGETVKHLQRRSPPSFAM